MTEKEFTMDDRYRIVLCGANTYDKKYYFNRKFDKIPENIKEELHIICVLFTEEAGGIFTIGFTPTGKVVMDSTCDEGDLLYDDIGSGSHSSIWSRGTSSRRTKRPTRTRFRIPSAGQG